MKWKYILYYIIFELISYKIFHYNFSTINLKYDYMERVYYFYFPEKNAYFYFYLYFIFTTSVFFTLMLWTKMYMNNKVCSDE